MTGSQSVEELLATIAQVGRSLTPEKIAYLSQTKRVENLSEAAAEACRTCPWRRENEDLETEDRGLCEANVVRLWNGLRAGVATACHKTVVVDAHLTEDDRARGWKAPPSSVTPRECAGALAQVLKEEKLRDELGSNEAYFQVRGWRGMTPHGFEMLARRRAGGPGIRPIRESNNPERYGRPWIPDPNGTDSLPIAPPCFCPTCTRHDEAHEMVDVVPPGSERAATVDTAMLPLLEDLWSRGAITLASCENLRAAVGKLSPEEVPLLEADHEPRAFNYSHVVRNGLAFVRGVEGPAWDVFADVVETLPLGQVMTWGPGIQLALRLADVPRLLEEVNAA